MLEIDNDQIEDFIFLIVTHELVHAIDDQHFNLEDKILGEIPGIFFLISEYLFFSFSPL